MTAADQTPATDSEREAMALPCDGGCDYNSGPEETCSRHGRPVAEVWGIVETLTARLAKQAEEHERMVGRLSQHSREGRLALMGSEHAKKHYDDDVARLTALLAEQAATIERLDSLVRDLHQTDGGGACLGCGTNEWGHPIASWPCETIRALGSQRTEGDS